MENKKFSIVLLAPEIPGNTGSIGRTCVALGIRLILIKPYGFDLSEKAVRRAGLDYWEQVRIIHWSSLEDFLQPVDETNLYFFTTKTSRSYTSARYKPGDYLIFGKETKGLPAEIRESYSDRCYTLPMKNKKIRSLNLAMTVGIVLYEAIRQQDV